jgi:hypothetical protein
MDILMPGKAFAKVHCNFLTVLLSVLIVMLEMH